MKKINKNTLIRFIFIIIFLLPNLACSSQDFFKLRPALQTNYLSGQAVTMLQERDFRQRFEALVRNAPYHYDLGKWLLKENWLILKGVLESKEIKKAKQSEVSDG